MATSARTRVAKKAPTKSAPAKKTAAKKASAAPKPPAAKAPAKKAPAKKTAAKTSAKKAPAKKTAAKTSAKKAPAKKSPVKKAPAKKTAAKTSAKKSAARKAPARRATREYVLFVLSNGAANEWAVVPMSASSKDVWVGMWTRIPADVVERISERGTVVGSVAAVQEFGPGVWARWDGKSKTMVWQETEPEYDGDPRDLLA